MELDKQEEEIWAKMMAHLDEEEAAAALPIYVELADGQRVNAILIGNRAYTWELVLRQIDEAESD